MKASDVQELQLKLQKLQQLQLKKNVDSESSEDVTEENSTYEPRNTDPVHDQKRNLRIDDFEISTTLGNL